MVNDLANHFHVVDIGRKFTGPPPVNPLGEDLTMSPITSNGQNTPTVTVTEMEAEGHELDNAANIDNPADIPDPTRGPPPTPPNTSVNSKKSPT
jgi:hypothetical protein